MSIAPRSLRGWTPPETAAEQLPQLFWFELVMPWERPAGDRSGRTRWRHSGRVDRWRRRHYRIAKLEQELGVASGRFGWEPNEAFSL